jgi:serine/threonine-protein kinase
VKRLVPEASGEEAIRALVQEARVTGSLEHPNIAPVHALGADAHGRPVMVMRRIHGTPWSALLRDKQAPDWAPAGDALAGHLEILLQVCNAVWFAHSRGIIHGDLKPDNVMLGAYGEVYVVDWGAALSTREDDPRGLPWAGAVRTVTGTPAYMAPEMIGLGAAISVRTDVFLLGAVLHEMVTGAPPHAGASMYDAMKTAFVARPLAYAPSVPAELAAICQRAMASDPADRFPDAHALRGAVAAYLDVRIAELARRRSQEARPTAAPPAPGRWPVALAAAAGAALVALGLLLPAQRPAHAALGLGLILLGFALGAAAQAWRARPAAPPDPPPPR